MASSPNDDNGTAFSDAADHSHDDNWSASDTSEEPVWHDPYMAIGARALSIAEKKEVEMYQNQDHFRRAEEERAQEFENKVWIMRQEFEESQKRERNAILKPLTKQIWFHGIKEARRMAVPAYTFEKFLNLPLELRLRIWNLIARLEEPDTYQFICIIPDQVYYRFESSYLNGRSEFRPESYKRTDPILFHICNESRSVARTIYTRFPYSDEIYEYPRRLNAYFNTLSASFYLGDKHNWSDFKILVDMLVKLNTTRPLPGRIPREMEAFKRIRNLIVDVGIFGALPGRIWTEFSSLSTFTISFYPPGPDTHVPRPSYEEESFPRFVKPRPRNCHYKWATHIYTHVNNCLSNVRLENPGWNPTIEVVAQINATIYSREEIDEDWGWDWEEFDHKPTDYEALENSMVHNVPLDEIRRLKHKFHPTRRLGTGWYDHSQKHPRRCTCHKCAEPGAPQEGEILTDSEAETGGRDGPPWLYDRDVARARGDENWVSL